VAGILLAVALGVFRRLGLMLVGSAMLAATAVGLLISVNVGLFGFQESLAVPYAGTSLVVEFAGAVLLAAAAAIVLARRPRRRPLAHTRRVWPPEA
jgi:formate hydrogenlyase subunit 4